MAELSVIVPVRNAVRPLAAQLDRLDRVLTDRHVDYEVVVVDDGSSPKAAEGLLQLARLRGDTRLLRFTQPVGLGPALATAIAGSRGAELLVVEAGGRYNAADVPLLLNRLRRADFVQGKRPRAGVSGLARRVGLAPRMVLLGSDVRDPHCLFWAARREAVVDLPAERGAEYLLAAYVALRGYRVDEQKVTTNPVEPSALVDVWPNPFSLLYAWAKKRRMSFVAAYELATPAAAAPILPLERDPANLPPPAHGHVAHTKIA